MFDVREAARQDQAEAIELTREDLRSERLQLKQQLPFYLRALPGWLTILLELLPLILQLFQSNFSAVSARRLRGNSHSPDFAAGYARAVADMGAGYRTTMGLPPRF